jgi:hypothetical protein
VRRRGLLTILVLAALGAAATFWPSPTFACDIRDPGCYIQDFVHKQLYDLNLSIWQINRAGLILARWFEDLRGWLIESVMVNIFTTLSKPVIGLFVLALIVAWMLFIVSFMVQSFVDLRWVDIRRAVRPILLAWLVYQFGGNFVLWTEHVRAQGGSLLQQTAQLGTQTAQTPGISSAATGDMPNASRSIYATETVCGTQQRAVEAMYLNDYDARYLWSNGNDIHCSDLFALAGEFQGKYFERMDISGESNSDKRQQAVRLAAQGGIRQFTGLLLTVGAIVEQIVHLVFAMALALVWFGLLLSLVFAVFLPTEALFSSQIKAILTVLRASWLASFLIGIDLAVLHFVAASGNGFLVFFCGLVHIAVCIWQGKQALETIGTALSSVSSVMGDAPQAALGMVKGWATTAAMVAGVAASGGGLGLALGQVGSTMLRRAGRQVGDNPVAQAAGRVLSNRLADRLDARLEDGRLEQDAEISTAEAAWYERSLYDGAGEPKADADAATQRETAKERARGQLALIKERQAERARKDKNFGKADRLRREADQLRGADEPLEETAVAPDIDPLDLDRAAERLYEAADDPEMQRQILSETAMQAQRRALLQARRNRLLREKRFDEAKAAIRDLRAMDALSPPATPTDQGAPHHHQAPSEVDGRSHRFYAQEFDELDRAIEQLSRLVAHYEQQILTPGADTDAARAGLADARRRLSEVMQQWAAQRPTQEDVYQAALTPSGTQLTPDMALLVARTPDGLVVNGHPVLNRRVNPGGGMILDTAGGSVPLESAESARVIALPVGGVLDVPPRAASGTPTGSASASASAIPPGSAVAGAADTPTAGPASSQQPIAGAQPVTIAAGQAVQGRSAGASGQRGGAGATATDSAAARPLHASDAPASIAPVPSSVPSPDLSALPPAAATPPQGEHSTAASMPHDQVAASAPAAPASVPVSQAAPTSVPSTAMPDVPSAPAPAVPASTTAPAAPAAPSVVTVGPAPTPAAPTPAPAAVPRAANDLPLSNGAGAAPAGAPAVRAAPAEASRPAVQPRRATSGPALPQVPEMPGRGAHGSDSRPDPIVAVPIAPAVPSAPASSPRPWKRGKRGES